MLDQRTSPPLHPASGASVRSHAYMSRRSTSPPADEPIQLQANRVAHKPHRFSNRVLRPEADPFVPAAQHAATTCMIGAPVGRPAASDTAPVMASLTAKLQRTVTATDGSTSLSIKSEMTPDATASTTLKDEKQATVSWREARLTRPMHHVQQVSLFVQ